jgi:uncharacterized membrane protein YidH (DUF202 family)
MLRTLLICGLLAGLAGGLLATGFAEVAGEPSVDKAIAFESGHAHGIEPVVVSRDLQRSVGLVTAAAIYGLAFGGMFALAFAFVYGRVGRASPGRTALWLAAGAFVVVFLVPFLKYPSNPPSVGHADTIERRTLLYLTMIAISLLVAVGAVRLRVALARRGPDAGPAATVVAVLAYVAVVAVAAVALPGIHEVPRGFPAETLWDFRLATAGMQLVLWATLGLGFAYGAQRVMTGQRLVPRRLAASPGD